MMHRSFPRQRESGPGATHWRKLCRTCSPSSRRALLPAAAIAVLLGLAACGVKGPPEPPPGADPAEVRDPPVASPPPPEGAAPDEPFILDGLLL